MVAVMTFTLIAVRNGSGNAVTYLPVLLRYRSCRIVSPVKIPYAISRIAKWSDWLDVCYPGSSNVICATRPREFGVWFAFD